MAFETKPPSWFYVVTILLILWDAIGCYFCVMQFRLGADAMGDATAYDRALYATLPVWYNWCYAVATFGSLLGGGALLLRNRMASWILLVALIAIVAMVVVGTVGTTINTAFWETFNSVIASAA